MLESRVLSKAQSWANNLYFDQKFRDEIQTLITKRDEDQLNDRFQNDLAFGTGGMRGITGVGSNRMNIYTVQKAFQGLANYLNKSVQKPSAAIAYDSRISSLLFAKETATILAGNGIQVHIFKQLQPTPLLSYAVCALKTTSGIVITASHNPSNYNGLKIYWSDGCQISSPQDKDIVRCIQDIEDFNEIKSDSFQNGLDSGMIQWIHQSIEESYYQKVVALSIGNRVANKSLSIVYTPLHGTGAISVKTVLKKRGFERLILVKEQEEPDGHFPTVDYPNPEEKSALILAMKTSRIEDDLILANDPDADRLGVMVRNKNTWIKLNGNQIGQVMLEYYLARLSDKNLIPQNAWFVYTIVTSELGRKIAENYGLKTKETLMGFKYIGKFIRELKRSNAVCIFATEESHGYLFGDFVRDKDGVSAAMIFAEIAADLKHYGKTILDFLSEIHSKYGYHLDSLITKTLEGHAGSIEIKRIMEKLRESPPNSLEGHKIVKMIDYEQQTLFDVVSNLTSPFKNHDISNVLAFYFEDGGRLTARPSGTEPKIKFYFNFCGRGPTELENYKIKLSKSWLQYIEGL